jgi:hypothetical protein
MLTALLEAIAVALFAGGGYLLFWRGDVLVPFAQRVLPWMAVGGGIALGSIAFRELRRFGPLRSAFQRFSVVWDRSRAAESELEKAEAQLQDALHDFHYRPEVEQSGGRS